MKRQPAKGRVLMNYSCFPTPELPVAAEDTFAKPPKEHKGRAHLATRSLSVHIFLGAPFKAEDLSQARSICRPNLSPSTPKIIGPGEEPSKVMGRGEEYIPRAKNPKARNLKRLNPKRC